MERVGIPGANKRGHGKPGEESDNRLEVALSLFNRTRGVGCVLSSPPSSMGVGSRGQEWIPTMPINTW